MEDRLISAKKLLDYIENCTEADGFWNGEKSTASFDALTDAINEGHLDTSKNSVIPRHIDEWNEDYGDVLWWAFPIQEPPYCGSPLDANWPAYHTHWTPIIVPDKPAEGYEEENSLKSKSINQLVAEAHENAVSKGWWNEERSFGEVIALMHSELSEALEDFRNGYMPHDVWYEKKIDGVLKREVVQVEEDWKPCGIPSELADVVIRVFDACGRYGIDLEQAITEKMAYNATRPQRHGGKKI